MNYENTMTEAERLPLIEKATERMLKNLEAMRPEDRPAYMQKLINLLPDFQLSMLGFAMEMSPTEKERREYLEEVARRRAIERGNNEE